jgi:hypothetical protein
LSSAGAAGILASGGSSTAWSNAICERRIVTARRDCSRPHPHRRPATSAPHPQRVRRSLQHPPAAPNPQPATQARTSPGGELGCVAGPRGH